MFKENITRKVTLRKGLKEVRSEPGRHREECSGQRDQHVEGLEEAVWLEYEWGADDQPLTGASLVRGHDDRALRKGMTGPDLSLVFLW